MSWAPDYVTVEEIRAYRELDDVGDDIELRAAVTAASRTVDRFCGRQFGVVAAVEQRRYQAEYDRRDRRWLIPVDDLSSATGLVVEFDPAADLTWPTTITAAEVDLWPANAAERSRPWTKLVVLPTATATPDGAPGSVRVTGLWGWATVPETVKQATLIQASRLAARRRSQFVEGGFADPTPYLPGTWDTMRAGPGVSVDPEVRVLLGGFRRNWGIR